MHGRGPVPGEVEAGRGAAAAARSAGGACPPATAHEHISERRQGSSTSSVRLCHAVGLDRVTGPNTAVGFQPAASFCFLKCVLVQNGCAEVGRIDDLGRHDQQRIAVRNVETIEVFRHYRGIRAVRHAVPAQISRLHLRRHDLQRPAARSARRERMPPPAVMTLARNDPSSRPTRPASRRPRVRGARNDERARLRAGVRLDLQRLVVLPGDVEAAGHAHDAGGAIGLALLARRFVSRRIPGVSGLTAGRVERHARDSPFGGVVIR